MSEIVKIIHTSKDIIKLYRAVQSIRIMLSCRLTQPINDIIKYNLVQSLVNYFNYTEHLDLQLEAALVLTNILVYQLKQSMLLNRMQCHH